MPTLSAARVVTPDGVLSPGAVEHADGLILAVEPTAGTVVDETLVPGFVDLQVNGLGEIDVAEASGADWDHLDDTLALHGVTAWCPTLPTAPLDSYHQPLSEIARAGGRGGPRPLVVGAHLEGPFLGEMAGSHPPELIRELDLDWLAALPPSVAVVTLGPEQVQAPEAVGALCDRGVLVAVGHTAATIEQVTTAADRGARLVTHCFNAMAPLLHRDPGPVGAALSDDRLVVSVIADLVHVHPAVLKLVFRAKGRGGVALVTDSVATGGGRRTEAVTDDGTVARLDDGTIAGSTTTMDQAVSNVVKRCDVPLEDAVAAASTTPARLLGLTDRGALRPGARADIVALDDELRATRTWIAGEEVTDQSFL